MTLKEQEFYDLHAEAGTSYDPTGGSGLQGPALSRRMVMAIRLTDDMVKLLQQTYTSRTQDPHTPSLRIQFGPGVGENKIMVGEKETFEFQRIKVDQPIDCLHRPGLDRSASSQRPRRTLALIGKVEERCHVQRVLQKNKMAQIRLRSEEVEKDRMSRKAKLLTDDEVLRRGENNKFGRSGKGALGATTTLLAQRKTTAFTPPIHAAKLQKTSRLAKQNASATPSTSTDATSMNGAASHSSRQRLGLAMDAPERQVSKTILSSLPKAGNASPHIPSTGGGSSTSQRRPTDIARSKMSSSQKRLLDRTRRKPTAAPTAKPTLKPSAAKQKPPLADTDVGGAGVGATGETARKRKRVMSEPSGVSSEIEGIDMAATDALKRPLRRRSAMPIPTTQDLSNDVTTKSSPSESEEHNVIPKGTSSSSSFSSRKTSPESTTHDRRRRKISSSKETTSDTIMTTKSDTTSKTMIDSTTTTTTATPKENRAPCRQVVENEREVQKLEELYNRLSADFQARFKAYTSLYRKLDARTPDEKRAYQEWKRVRVVSPDDLDTRYPADTQKSYTAMRALEKQYLMMHNEVASMKKRIGHVVEKANLLLEEKHAQ